MTRSAVSPVSPMQLIPVSQMSVPFVDFSDQHQPIQAEIEQAIHRVIQHGNFVLGEPLAQFEAEFAAACGTGYGVGVACGTDAIALGLQACGIGAGDEVILPANTFVATLIGVMRAGAAPILVDCDRHTALIDLDAAERAITKATKAIVPVHLYGQMVSPQQLLAFADRHNLVIFEDAAQAHLAERDGYRAGSVGIAAAFSFYPSKNLGAMGDGGMVVTRDAAIAQKLKSLRNYGAPRKYFHADYGTNSRLDSLQAAVLQVKLPHLPSWNSDRNRAAHTYDQLLAPLRDYGIMPIQNHTATGHVYHLYVVQVTPACRFNRDALLTQLGEHGIQTGIHYPIPCHLQPAFEGLGYATGAFPHAEFLCDHILSLPMYPGLKTAQIEYVVDTLTALVK